MPKPSFLQQPPAARHHLAWPWALALFCAAPFMGWATVRFFEKLDQFFGGCRAVVFFITRRWYFVRLLAERQAIREEILALADEAAPTLPAQVET